MALSKKVLGGAIGGQTFIITDMKKDISQNYDINDKYISIIKTISILTIYYHFAGYMIIKG